MRVISLFIFSIVISCFSSFTWADPVLLYDSTGTIAAVVDSSSSSASNIYLATSGEPVGYVYSNGAVYSYSGRHLGWYSDGVFWDVNGYMVAFADTKRPPTVHITPGVPVALKTTIPTITTTRQVITTKPVFVNEVSTTPFSTIFTVPTTDTTVTVQPVTTTTTTQPVVVQPAQPVVVQPATVPVTVQPVD